LAATSKDRLMRSALSYLDFDLLIRRTEVGYRAQVLASPAGEAAADFTAPFSGLELENLLLKMGRPRRGTRHIGSPQMEVAKTLGKGLYDSVFSGDVKDRWRSSQSVAEAQNVGLRLRLRITDAPELNDVPWEYLYTASLNQFLLLSDETPLIRYLELPRRIQPLAVDGRLEILVMISSPTDYQGLDVEGEWSRLNEALAGPVGSGQMRLERLPEARLAVLRRVLSRGEYHILHFIGHAGFDRETQDGLLVLCDEAGRGRPVPAHHLSIILHDHRSLRLVVLNACEGARASGADPFAGAAQSLVQQGIPAVIAMQFEITDQAAVTFAEAFYAEMADGHPVDAALAEARKAILAANNDIEWGTPVLYLRAPDGQLFSVNRGLETARLAAEEQQRAEAARLAAEDEQRAEAEEQRAEAARQAAEANTVNSLPTEADGWQYLPADAGAGPTGSNQITQLGASQAAEVPAPDGPEQMNGSDPGAVAQLAARANGSDTANVRVRPSTGRRAIISLCISAALLLTVVGAVSVHLLGQRPLIRTLSGHSGAVDTVAFSPDGHALVSGSYDTTVKLWDVASGGELRTLRPHSGSVAFSPDGRTVASGAGHNTIKLWDVTSGGELRTLSGQLGNVNSVAFSPDGRTLASGDTDMIKLWDVASGGELRTLNVHVSKVNSVAFSPDGRTLVSGSNSGPGGHMIKLWDVASGSELRNVNWRCYVNWVAFSPDGHTFASGGGDPMGFYIRDDDDKGVVQTA
jgi:hypothetical protein